MTKNPIQPLQTAAQEAPSRKDLSNAEIKAILLSVGYTIKPGLDDLKPYVYSGARALIAMHDAKQGNCTTRAINDACPFCGGDSQTDFIEGESYIIECGKCGARTDYCDEADEAWAAWRNRVDAQAALAAQAAEIARLTAERDKWMEQANAAQSLAQQAADAVTNGYPEHSVMEALHAITAGRTEQAERLGLPAQAAPVAWHDPTAPHGYDDSNGFVSHACKTRHENEGRPWVKAYTIPLYEGEPAQASTTLPEPVAIASKGRSVFFVKWTAAGADLLGAGIELYTGEQLKGALQALQEDVGAMSGELADVAVAVGRSATDGLDTDWHGLADDVRKLVETNLAGTLPAPQRGGN